MHDQISPHMIRIIDFASGADRWVTTKEIALGAGVARRTACAHALKLATLGVFEQIPETFGGHRFRLATTVTNTVFLARVGTARAAFNMGGLKRQQ